MASGRVQLIICARRIRQDAIPDNSKDVKMSKLIKWGLLAIVAVAILIKASLWLSVRSIMNDAVAQMSPFMNLSYQGITSSFDGRVGVEGIKVQVPMFNDEFHIAHAELKFKGLMDLLSFKERLAEGKFPEQMAVNIKGLRSMYMALSWK
jgi:hypothetical protein